MTLLSLIQDAALEVGGISVPSIVFGNGDINVQRMLRAAQRVGSDLTQRADWPVMRASHVFTATTGETQAGAVPAPFARLVPRSVWDRTNRVNISGPIPGAQYQSIAAGYPSDGPARWFTLRGAAMDFFPGFAGGETVAFDYITGQFAQSAAGAPLTRWAADSDVGRISEELMTLGVVAFFLLAQGLPHAAQMAAYEARMEQEIRNAVPVSRVLASADVFTPSDARNWTGTPQTGGGW